MNSRAGDTAVGAAAACSTGDLAAAALNGVRKALKARVAVVRLEGRIAARNLLLAALYGAVALLAVLAGWLALQVALVLALVASGVLSMLGASIVVALGNGVIAFVLVDVSQRHWRDAGLPVTRRLLDETLGKGEHEAA
jgi:O-antigen ligase